MNHNAQSIWMNQSRKVSQYSINEMDSIFIQLPDFEGILAIESANFLGVGGITCICTNDPVSCRFDCCECCEVFITFDGVLLAILLDAASERCGGGTLPLLLPLLLAASASASSSPRFRVRISYSHSLLRSTASSRLSSQMAQVNLGCNLKSSLYLSTRRILSQFQSQSRVGLMSTQGVSSSSLSSSIRIALVMYFKGCFQLRRTTQQESMLRIPPQTILLNLTWYVDERLIIYSKAQRASSSYHEVNHTNKRSFHDILKGIVSKNSERLVVLM